MSKKAAFITLVIAASVFLFSFYGDVISSPNEYLFGNTGDGLKNYYTYIHHIKNDSSYMEFSGMNYPYGEHFLYTDCHPILANTFKYLSTSIPYFETNAIGILNFLLISSIFLTFLAVYFLLLKYKLKPWISILFSISITLLAPQIFRIDGHYALSYSLAIPLSWLLLVRQQENKKFATLLLFLNNLFWMFIHAYLGIIVLFFLAAIIGVQTIAKSTTKRTLLQFLKLSSAILVPILFFFTFSKLTDNHTNRTDNPSGFFLYNAELDDVFIPHHGEIRPLLNQWTNNAIKLKWEAWSYVGIANTLLTIFVLLLALFSIFVKKKRKNLIWFFKSKDLNIVLIASFVVLLFAMAIPFRQFPSLIDHIPILKHFRATGRFTWPFYFSLTIFFAFIFNQLFVLSKGKNKTVISILIVVITGIHIWEAIPYHQEISAKITQTPNLFKYESLPTHYQEALSSIDSKDYQAILPIPFYYLGSESYDRPLQEKAVQSSILMSYHSGLPNFSAALTRTSITESKNIVQLMSPNYYTKKIEQDIPNEKPILIVRTNENITTNEKNILDQAELIYKHPELELYRLEKSHLFKNNASQAYNNYLQQKPNLFTRNGLSVNDSSGFYYYQNFDKQSSSITYRGSGSYSGVKKGKNTFTEFPPSTFKKNQEYELRFWMYNGEKDALNLWFQLIVEEYDAETDQWHTTSFFPSSAEVIDDDWSLVSGTFSIKNPNNDVYITSKGKENSKTNLHADDLLIFEKGMEIYSYDEKNKVLLHNNHKIKLD